MSGSLLKTTVVGAGAGFVLATQLTSPEILTIIGAIGALVVTVGGAIVQIITSLRKTIDDNEKVAAADRAIIVAKAEAIEGHVNSAATAATAKREALEDTVKDLRALIEEQRRTADLLAQTAARRSSGRATDPPAGGTS